MYKKSAQTLLFSLVALNFTLGSIHAADVTELKVVRSRATGNASLVTMAHGGALPVQANTAAPLQPIDFFRQHGALFGIAEADRQLQQSAVHRDTLGQVHTKFHQIHRGIRVFGGSLRTHQNDRGEFVAASGEFLPVSPKIDSNPRLDRADAERVVRDAFVASTANIERLDLVIVDPGWYGDRPQGERLAYFCRIANWAEGQAEAFFVDAQSGRILDRWNLVETIRNRRIHDAGGGSGIPGPLARVEGQSPDSDVEVNRAYDYAGDTYDYFWRAFGRDSFNDSGAAMVATVNSRAVPCPNAFWNGTQTVYCTGMAHDDVVGHEFTHAIIQYTADLIYQNQPGQLNESYADIFGELIDLFNGDLSLPGPPAGPPWPAHPSGPGVDLSNQPRESCIGGVHFKVLEPELLTGTYQAGQALFGPSLDETGVTGELVAAEPALACGEMTNSVTGKIVLVDRGMCNFDYKVSIAQQAGALGVIVANNREGPLPFLPGSDPTIAIPSVGISQEEGDMLRAAMSGGSVIVTLGANDNSGVRWLIGEDGFGGQFRDMWMPSCLGDPDTANHPFQTCNPSDNGGVHSGSGVPNHAFALVTDGGTFGGFTVDAVGPIKSGAVWYRALTTYLTEISDFEDAFAGLNQAALDLVGTFPLDPRTGFPSDSEFTAHDAAQVSLALQAVEMNTPGRCGSFDTVLNPEPFEACALRVTMYADGFEQGVPDWTVHNSNPPTPYDWVVTGMPWGMPGLGWFADDPDIGDCQTKGEAGVHSLTSPFLFVWDEAQEFFLSFTHLVATEPAYDGGNVKISVNEGPFELIPPDAFLYNVYNAAIPPDSSNPLAGEYAFTGRGAEWGTSYVNLSDLANGGDLVQFRFDFGKDACGGHDGWYISDIAMFYCVPVANGDFDHDDKVTLADVAHFERCMHTSVRSGGPCVPGDLDGNGFINFFDFTPLVELLDDP